MQRIAGVASMLLAVALAIGTALDIRGVLQVGAKFPDTGKAIAFWSITVVRIAASAFFLWIGRRIFKDSPKT